MAYSDAAKNATYKYREKRIKRVPLDMQIPDYERLKSAAEAAGESVNGYIKAAIQMRMEKEPEQAQTTPDEGGKASKDES